MSSKRLAFAGGILSVGIILVALVYGCGDTEQAFGPNELVLEPALDLGTNVSETKPMGEGIILVAIPKTGELKEIYDPWIADAILSLLPDATLARFTVKGLVYVYDMELAGEIVAMVGIEAFDVSGGILMGGASLGCIKSCYSYSPLCSPCPQCCDKDKDNGRVPFIEY